MAHVELDSRSISNTQLNVLGEVVALERNTEEKKKNVLRGLQVISHIASTHRRLRWPVKVFDKREAVRIGGVQALRRLRVKLLGALHKGGDQS